ncbi:MAG: hypothetical protein NTW04_02280, partial [Elusimicrobia bacterium]|nr:hypothetical protein [Elusimicrobiota bacterium]
MDFEKISPSELEKILLSPPKIARGKNLKPAAYAESLVAVGDIHGEAEGFIHVMSHAGIIDKAMHWSGDGKTLIQIGDVIDRGAYS